MLPFASVSKIEMWLICNENKHAQVKLEIVLKINSEMAYVMSKTEKPDQVTKYVFSMPLFVCLCFSLFMWPSAFF